MPIYKPNKPYTEDINDLVAQSEMILKGKALPPGTTRNWSGKTYVKQGNGDWTPITAAKNETPVVEHKEQSHKEEPKSPGENKGSTNKDSSNQVTDHEKSSLKEYQSGLHGSALGGYANLQSHLREGKPQYGKFTPEESKLADEVVAHVSSAIKKHPITEPTTVYRGLKVKKDDPKTHHFMELKVGDTFSDKGFTSTSTSKAVADKFKDKLNRSDQPIVMEIQLKPGNHALPMNKYHKSGENEVLLDKDTKFKVVSVKDSGTHRKLVIEIA